MKLSELDLALWGAYFVGEVVLLFTLIHRRRWNGFPVFTAIICGEVLVNVALYMAHTFDSASWYSRIYYGYAPLYFVLQLGMTWEIAQNVMRPTGTWVRDAKKQFILCSATGILTATVLSWFFTRPVGRPLERLGAWADLFVDLVFCELLIAMLLIAKRLGLGFRNHVFSLVLGWSLAALGSMPIDLLRGYYGTHFYFDILSNVGQSAFFIAVLYWTVQFWADEPARRPISPELSAYIENLHRRIENNLDIMDAQR
jgi:hypothetical protein